MNIFYLLLEKLNGFAELAKYDVNVPHGQIAPDYETKRGDAFARIEELNITKRMVSTCTFTTPLSCPKHRILTRICPHSQVRAVSTRGWSQPEVRLGDLGVA